MIAIDTNILLRWVLDDDQEQAEAVGRLLERGEYLLVTDVVLCETIWTLRGGAYRLEDSILYELVLRLLKHRLFTFEDNEVIWETIKIWSSTFADGKKSRPDFADVLISQKVKAVCKCQSVRFGGLVTFDRGASSLPDAHLLT